MNVGGSDGRLTMSGCGWMLQRDARSEMPDRGRHQTSASGSARLEQLEPLKLDLVWERLLS